MPQRALAASSRTDHSRPVVRHPMPAHRRGQLARDPAGSARMKHAWIISPSEGSHPRAGFLDERSWSHDTYSLARTEVSDVMRHEHPRPCADRRGEDRDVLGLGKLARPFTVVWGRPVDLD